MKGHCKVNTVTEHSMGSAEWGDCSWKTITITRYCVARRAWL